MFTGIITATGKVKKIQKNKKFLLTIETNKNFVKKAKLGSSIAIDGVCLTVVKIIPTTPNPSLKRRGARQSLVFELMPETVRLTIAGDYTVKTIVNLEHSLRVGDELGGHFVAGHVDGVGRVVKIKREKESVIMTIKPPRELLKYLAHKGSVAINGVSLTLINQASSAGVSRRGLQRRANMRRSPLTGDSDWAEGIFNVSLVTYTLKHTNLSKLKVKSKVNIEVDMLARYVERIMNNE